MYVIPESNGWNQPSGLRGLAQPRDTSDRQKSLDAILKALKLNPVGGYVKGSPARKQLEKAIESVPLTSAFELHTQLKNGTGVLGKLFQYRLHSLTRAAMLGILWTKHLEQQKQLREAQEILKKLCDEKKQMLEKMRVVLVDYARSVENICKLHGEDSDQCQKARFELLEANVKHDDDIRATKLRCP